MIGVNNISTFKKRFDSMIGKKGGSSKLMSSTEFLKMKINEN